MIRAVFLCVCGVCASSRLLAQCPDGSPPPCTRPTPGANSVAVLPLENRAGDTSLVLLAEGLADQITTNLGQVERLATAPPASVRFVLGRTPREPARLARALNVRWLVDGQLLPGKGSARVSIQLIDAATQRVRWSGAFQRPTDDIFAVITAVADSVATAVVGTLAPAERARLAQRPTASNQAAVAYARGLAALHHFTWPSLKTAVTAFDSAIAADSGFVAAYAAKAEAWIWQDRWVPPREAYAQARAAARRALAIDSMSAPALTALAGVALFYDWDPARAESLTRRALLRDSTRARTWLYLGEALAVQGRADTAADALRRAVTADTLDEDVAIDASWVSGVTRHYDQGLDIARRWKQLLPDEDTWDFMKARLLLYAHRCAADPPQHPKTPLALVCAGKPEVARAVLDSMIAQAKRDYGFTNPGFVAVNEAVLGDRDAALYWLEQDIDGRGLHAVFAAVDPIWDSLRDDPRFIELLKRVKPATE